ncbi:MAG: LysR family transcriptional regulator [Oscillospiraceae bacterium]|nr:LysR family transcriptional regulator [Oscillospiraceae bacterium]
MKTKEIEIISEIVNYRRFADAADNLSYSHSVISKYVTGVENELGIKLFVRGNKASELSLTPEGRIVIPAIQRVNDDYHHVLELVKRLKNDNESIIRIGSPLRFNDFIEQEILSDFIGANPGIKVHQTPKLSVDLLKMLRARRLDATFIALPDDFNLDALLGIYCDGYDVDVRFIKNEPVQYAVVSDEYFTSTSDVANFADLKDYTFIFPISNENEEHSIWRIAEEQAYKSGFTLKTMFSNVYDSTLLRIVRKMPAAILTSDPDENYSGVRFIRISDWNMGFSVYFLSPKDDKRRSLQLLRHCCASFADGNKE